MLQEVSQATLARFFQDRAYTLGDIEVGESRLLVVMTDVISESVLQLTLSDRRILHHVLGRERYRDCSEKEQTEELFLHIEDFIKAEKVISLPLLLTFYLTTTFL